MNKFSRRHALCMATSSAAVAMGSIATTNIRRVQANEAAASSQSQYGGIRFCLNTSTVRGHNLSITEQVDLASGTGYDAIEPWMSDLVAYRDSGGNLDDLRKRIADAGLTVESAIGFASWIVDDPDQRQKGLQQARSDMELLSAIGGRRIAAPPVGATKQAGPELAVIAERYRALLQVGEETGVTPELELWGFSKTMSRLGELAYVATEAAHEDACVLPDVYHIYKGGSHFAGLGMIEATRMPVFHMNDYPADPLRESISDADRVYPGDGVAPLDDIIGMLHRHGFRGFFSLELFNRDYWNQPAKQVARTGLEKMKAAVSKALNA